MPERLHLKDGKRWIDIKDVFRMKDKKDVHSYANDGVINEADGRTSYKLSPVKYRMGQMAAWIVNWNFTEDALVRGPNGTRLEARPVPFPAAAQFKDRIAAIENLDEATGEEVSDLLSELLLKRELEAQAEKNAILDGEMPSEPSSPSAS